MLAAPSRASAAAPDAASAADRPSSTGSGHSYAPVFSADGRFIAFVSQAHNLVTNDTPGPCLNVFVRDLAASNTVLVSVNTNGLGSGDDNANFPSLSANGRFVAFESAASNLVPGDTNGLTDIFVRDLAGGTTRLVSVATNGANADGASTSPQLSADGRWVFFESRASNLVANDLNGVADIFVRDLLTGTTALMSADATNAGPATGACEAPAITPDGRFVAFVKHCTNTFPCGGLAESRGDLYVRDRESGALHWASAAICTNFGSYGYEYRCLNPVLSDDGRYVVFRAMSDVGGPTVLFRRDLVLHETTQLDSLYLITSTSWPAVSAAGDRVAYEGPDGLRLWEESTQSNRLIFPAASPVRCLSPAMTPDGSRIAFLVASNATALLYVQDVATGSNRVAGLTTNGLPATVNEVTAPELSGDGRQVAFETLDRRLVADDFNLAADIFVFDLDAQTTELVSRRAAGRPARTLAPMSTAVPGGLSANGRFAAFLIYDTQQGEDTNEWRNVVVRDLVAGTGQVVGLATNGTREPALSADGRHVAYTAAPREGTPWRPDSSPQSVWRWDSQTGSHDPVANIANKYARAPAISPDGNLVAFHSSAAPAELGLAGLGEGNSGTDVFLRDMSRATNELISVNRLGTATGNGLSEYPVFSPNGRWLIFRSAATDLTTNGLPGLFARDLWSNTTVLVSFPPSVLPLSAQPTGVVFSADSRFVAFANTNVVGLYDLHARTGSVVCANCRAPSLSAEGRLLACELLPDPLVQPPAYRQILVKDLRTGATNLASVSCTDAATGGNAHSDAPSLSYDGRFVVFTSKASNLVPDDTNGVSDVFVRDLRLGTTRLVSRNRAGTGSGDAPSGRAIMAADGRTVLFQSFAGDLVEGDFNDRRDVFVLRLGGPDTDGDGLDDDWEVAYFGDLSHDGTADTDHDGLTDSNEFQAGTDPTNSGSILRAITVTSLGSGAKTILWSATPGRTYIVQYKDSLDDKQWTPVPSTPVTAAGTTGAAVDVLAGAAPQRFYRVVLVP